MKITNNKKHNFHNELEFLENISRNKNFNNNEFHLEKYNHNYRLIDFKLIENINNCTLITDSDLYGGDTVAEIGYTLEESASILIII